MGRELDIPEGAAELVEAVMRAGLTRRQAELATVALIGKKRGRDERGLKLELERIVSWHAWEASHWDEDAAALRAAGLWPFDQPVQES